jgi:hypothetical protein
MYARNAAYEDSDIQGAEKHVCASNPEPSLPSGIVAHFQVLAGNKFFYKPCYIELMIIRLIGDL